MFTSFSLITVYVYLPSEECFVSLVKTDNCEGGQLSVWLHICEPQLEKNCNITYDCRLWKH